ncbi:MAG: dephospho-CoA kinase [Simkaniaceae bacterium]|nr:dephospho-CoA kinase [Candidatus Sacchlamyda saccharinae]
MLILKKIAITGGLSCGKSAVCQILQKLGAYVVSADVIVHQLFSPSSTLFQPLIALLGEDVIQTGRIEPRLVASKVFSNQETLKALEALIHPAVLEEIENQAKQAPANTTLFVAEIPLLYEIEKDHLFDTVVAVVSDEKLAKKRFQEKTNHSMEEFEKRMTHQLPPSEKSARADYTILNNGTLKDLEMEVKNLHQQINPGQ